MDLRVGAAFTRFQTLRFQPLFAELDKKIISYGSCQFPTLGFVVEQYRAREEFVQEAFWSISAAHTRDGINANFTWHRGHLFDRLICMLFYERCIESPLATVTEVSSKPTRNWRPLPLTTVALQKTGSSILKMTSHKVMQVAESLYNKGFLSYPRTETDEFDKSFELMELVQHQTTDRSWGQYALKLVQSLNIFSLLRLIDGAFKWPRAGKNNDHAHPPIHPTKHADGLTGDDKKIYDYVTRHFLACCSEDAIGQQSTVKISIAGESFHTGGLQVLERNYLEVYTYRGWNSHSIPNYKLGEVFTPSSCTMHEGKSSPPSLLSEADLIATMDANGIGTDATIAEHIKKIQDREYVFKEGIYFVPSVLGLALVDGYDKIAFDTSLAKPFLRRQMEASMNDICNGLQMPNAVVQVSVRMYKEMFEKANEKAIEIERAMNKHFGKDVDENDANGGPPQPPAPGAGNGNQRLSAPPGNNPPDDEDDDNPKNDFQPRPQPYNNPQFANNVLQDCSCGAAASQKKVSKDGPNKDRSFWSCSDRVCDFFKWADSDVVKTLNISFQHHASNAPGSNCQCNTASVARTVSKEGPNNGRQFYCCSAKVCDFFQWQDQQPSAGTLNSLGSQANHIKLTIVSCNCGVGACERTVTKEGSNKGRLFHGCASKTCDFFAWKDGYSSQMPNMTQRNPLDTQYSTPGDSPVCDCGQACAERSVTKEGPNVGRKFFTCLSKQCQFFQWHDASSTSQNENSNGVAFGFGVNVAPKTTKPKCQCDLYATLKTSFKEGSNQNKKFWTCPNVMKKCSFFQWEDESGVNPAAGARGSSSTSTCYECGQTGHFASACPKKGSASSSSDFKPKARGSARSTRGSRGTSRGGGKAGTGTKRTRTKKE